MEIKSYKKKNGDTAYGFRIYVGKENGKDKYVKRQGFPTKAKARAALLQLQDDLENGEQAKKEITVEEVAKKWLNEYADTVQDSTYIKTERNIKNHIYPVFGSKKITSITPLQLQEQINEWSKKLVYGRKLKGLMNNIFKYAIRYGYISANPVDSVTTLVKKESDSSSDFYDKDELKSFMKLVDDTDDLRKKVMFRLLAFTGARKGEILALKWTDWIDNTLNINKAITRGFEGESVGATKNKSSVRLISLDQRTIDLLSEYREMNPATTFIFESP